MAGIRSQSVASTTFETQLFLSEPSRQTRLHIQCLRFSTTACAVRQERLATWDEKHITPLLVHTEPVSALARLYDKIVLDEHYANLYGPAAVLETQKEYDAASLASGSLRSYEHILPREVRQFQCGRQGWPARYWCEMMMARHCLLFIVAECYFTQFKVDFSFKKITQT